MTNNGTKENNNSNSNSNIKNFAKKILRGFEVVLITNPLFFWIWASICPARVAKLLLSPYYYDRWIGEKYLEADKWEILHLVSRKAKFAFMRNYRTSTFPDKDQEELFNFLCDCRENWNINDFSPEVQHNIWKHNFTTQVIAYIMLEEGFKPTPEEIVECIKAKRFWIVEYFNAKCTFPWKVMEALYTSNDPEGKILFFDQVRRNGAKSNVAELVEGEEDREQLFEALHEYSQYCLTKASRNDEGGLFRRMLEKEKDLCPRTQMILTLAQYKTYHSHGKKLDKNVILHKADPSNGSDWKAWTDNFLRWEDLTFPEWTVLVLNNSELRTYLLKNQGVL